MIKDKYLDNHFTNILSKNNLEIKRYSPEILQLNVGKLCNIKCVHCHVNAGPQRTEIITRETIDKIIPWFEKSNIQTLDMTGGTPEMIPDFKYLVKSVRSFTKKRKIIDRLNPTIINESGYEWVAEFLAENKIEIVSSLPCYSQDNVDSQRGIGVFESSINALKKLNELGYGKNPELILNFVYNPNGAFLPGDQEELKADYKKELFNNFGIFFNNLFCITNMPISRFAGYLKNNNKYKEYINLLINSFNPSTVEGLMCRNTVNVSWKGVVFDCDFNQMLNMNHIEKNQIENTNYDNELQNFKINQNYNTNKTSVITKTAKITNPLKIKKQFLWDLNLNDFIHTPILTGTHCFGCTSGSGSSCGGSLI